MGLTWPSVSLGGGGTPVVHWIFSAPQVKSAINTHTLEALASFCVSPLTTGAQTKPHCVVVVVVVKRKSKTLEEE